MKKLLNALFGEAKPELQMLEISLSLEKGELFVPEAGIYASTAEIEQLSFEDFSRLISSGVYSSTTIH